MLHMLEACYRAKVVPSDLSVLLNHLHATEPKPPDGLDNGNRDDASSTGTGGGSTAVASFVERKTRAYNELIRLCDAAGTREEVFIVLDEMESNKIEVGQRQHHAFTSKSVCALARRTGADWGALEDTDSVVLAMR